MESQFNAAISSFFINMLGGTTEFILNNANNLMPLSTPERVNYIVTGLGINRPTQSMGPMGSAMGAMGTALAGLGMGQGMMAAPAKPTSSRSKNKPQKVFIPFEQYNAALERGERICAYMMRSGDYKGHVCGAPAINADMSPDSNKWRCKDDLNKAGIIEKHAKPKASGQTNAAIPGLTVPNGIGMGSLLGGMGMGMGPGVGSLGDLASHMLGEQPYDTAPVHPQLVAIQSLDDKSIYVAPVNGVSRIVIQETGQGLVCRGRLSEVPVTDKSKVKLPADWDKTLVPLDMDDHEYLTANKIPLA